MKQPQFLSILLLLVLFTACFSGCLGGDDSDKLPEGGEIIFRESAGINVFSIDDEIYVEAVVILNDTSNQTVLEKNITVERSGNVINISIPVYQTADAGQEEHRVPRFNISLGKRSDFDNGGDFLITVNGGEINEYTKSFSVEDEILYNYEPASIENGHFELGGDDIVYVLGILHFNSASGVDYTRAVQSAEFDSDNRFSIYLPVKIAEYGHSVNDKRSAARFIVGNQKELEDGEYVVSINGNDLPFEIKNNTLINELSFDSVWDFAII